MDILALIIHTSVCTICVRAATFLHACYRSHVQTAPSPCMPIRVRARAFSPSNRHAPSVPIMAPERSSRLGGQMRFLAACRLNTHPIKQLCPQGCISYYILLSPLIRLCPRCRFDYVQDTLGCSRRASTCWIQQLLICDHRVERPQAVQY